MIGNLAVCVEMVNVGLGNQHTGAPAHRGTSTQGHQHTGGPAHNTHICMILGTVPLLVHNLHWNDLEKDNNCYNFFIYLKQHIIYRNVFMILFK